MANKRQHIFVMNTWVVLITALLKISPRKGIEIKELQEKYCPNKICRSHTVCKPYFYQKCFAAQSETILMDSQIRIIIVHMHNMLRNQVALGEEGQPPATNMKELVWDAELAVIAQRWANNCHVEGPDKCRDVDRYKVNQFVQLHNGLNTNAPLPVYEWRDTLIDWFSGKSNVTPEIINTYRFNASYEKYTQMVWANLSAIGCGYNRAVYAKEDKVRYHSSMVCNYGPAGNQEENPVYLKGNACSQCAPSRRCFSYFAGLCSYSGVGTPSAGLLLLAAVMFVP